MLSTANKAYNTHARTHINCNRELMCTSVRVCWHLGAR